MIYLKKANLEDAEKEYELIQKIPAEENGFQNKAYGVSFEEFVNITIPRWQDHEKGINLEDGHVPDTYYFLWVDDIPVGIFKLRHCLNDRLREGAGHVGYGIAKEYRGKGYATEGLHLIVEEARKLPIDTDEIYLSVLKDNPASLKVQQKNGATIVGEDDTHYYTRIPLYNGLRPKLKVGLDLDGVVFDSETTFRTYEEIFDIERNQNKLVDRSEPKYQKRYSWNEAEMEEFQKLYLEISQNSPLMPGFKKVYELLKKEGVELIAITARGLGGDGTDLECMEDDAKRILEENNIVLDKYYWKQKDKLEVCQNENIDIMIDDDYKIIEKIASCGIKTLYFRAANLKKLDGNGYITEVNNWGDIYRIIHNYPQISAK